jgi:hypothetical protein
MSNHEAADRKVAESREGTDARRLERKKKNEIPQPLSPEREQLLRSVLAVMALAAVDGEVRRRSQKLRSDRASIGSTAISRAESIKS